VDGRSVALPSTGDTVRAALADAKVAVDKDDEVTPSLDSPVPNDGTIRVTRVTYQEGSEEQKIPYKIQIQPASKGNRPYHPTVTRDGKNGIRKITWRAKLVDGREVERKTVADEVVREPVNAVVTARQPTQLGSRGAYVGARTITVIATAYDPGPGSCGKYANGQTCNGKRAGYGIIAVDPKVIPLGSKLYVEGYGYGIAADVGGAIKGNHVDLGFNSRSASFGWGKRLVKLQILE
jgi:3D (Asp-Asp-Asp) domain-containing protein